MNNVSGKRWLALPVAGLALAMAACGGPSYGDVEGQVLAMSSASQPPQLMKDVSIVIAGNGIDCGQRRDLCVARTDASGKYMFKEVPAGAYAVAFNAPETDVKYQEESRQFTVSPNAAEVVSVVLLAEGMARPEVPAELANRPANQQGSVGSSLTGNPFFWYWMFNQPWVGGYSRPPVVVMNPDRSVTVDRTQPTLSNSGRQYSSYGPSAKPAPVKVDSRGVTRPGQAPVGSGSSASSGASSSTARSQSPVPPRVGSGSSSTASRSPARSSPPRVRVGRR
jgi:hypothetical protein